MLTKNEVYQIVDSVPPQIRPGQAVFNYVAGLIGREGLPEGGNWNTLFYRCHTTQEVLAELRKHNLLWEQ